MIDFIIEALFSTDGYSVAFSPLMLLPSLGSAAYGMAQNAKLKKDLEQKKKAAASEFERSLTAIRGISFEPGQGVRDLSTSMETAGLEMGRKGEERTDATTARLIAAMSDDPRAGAAAGQRGIGSALKAQQGAEEAGTKMKLGAQKLGVDAEEAGRQAGIQRDLGLEQLLMGTAQKAGDVAQSGGIATDTSTTEGFMSMGNVLSQALIQYGGGGGGGAATRSTEDPSDDNIGDPQDSTMFDWTAANGIRVGEGGGMTEGEFDHASNKKAIVDEENGQKEGELTGGEIVFNPEQTADITGMVDSGDADGLLLLLQELLNQPQFQKA